MHPQRKAEFVTQDIGGETIVYTKDDEAIHVLNSTAKCIWDLCDGQHALEEIEQALRACFEIQPEQDVRSDIQRVLAVFQAKGLIQPLAAA